MQGEQCGLWESRADEALRWGREGSIRHQPWPGGGGRAGEKCQLRAAQVQLSRPLSGGLVWSGGQE